MLKVETQSVNVSVLCEYARLWKLLIANNTKWYEA